MSPKSSTSRTTRRSRTSQSAQFRLEPLETRCLLSLTDSLIGYWPFDTTGADVSGSSRNLNLQGGVGFAPGLFGQALDLHNNGAQYAIRPVDDASYDFGSGDFTVQVWVNFNGDPSTREQTLIEKFSGSDGPGWTLTKVVGNQYVFASNPSANIVSPAQSVPANTWHQVLVRRVGTAFDLFYDGRKIASAIDADPIPDTTMPLLVGKRNDLDGRNFAVDGRLDEAALWARGLSDAEVSALYNGGTGTRIDQTGPMYVAQTTPASGSTIDAAPTDFTIRFSQPFDATTLQASDLTVNGIGASSVTTISADTASFHYNATPVSVIGAQSFAMAAGAVAADPATGSASPLLMAFSGTFTYLPTPSVVDTSFGTAGTGIVASSAYWAGDGGGNPVGVYPSTDPSGNAGKIVVVGYDSGTSATSKFTTMRYNTNGTLDSSWGGTGVVTTSISNLGDSATTVAFQPDGKLLVGGSTRTIVTKGGFDYVNNNFALVRYQANGSLDTSFGQGGKVTIDLSPWDWKKKQANQSDLIKSIVVQPDGKILVAGFSGGGVGTAAMVRYNASGTLDTTFGSGGTVRAATGEFGAILNVELQTIGTTTKIITFGDSTNNQAYVARYNTAGVLDTTFGSGGRIIIANLNSLNSGGAVLPNGSILAAGTYNFLTSGGQRSMGVAKLTPNGALDTSFNGTGIAVTQFPYDASCYAMALQPNGSIVLGGQVRLTEPTPHTVAALARLTPTGQLDTSFNTTGLVIHEANPASILGLALQQDGKIVAVGNGPKAVAARYLGGSSPLRAASISHHPILKTLTRRQLSRSLNQAFAYWRARGETTSQLGHVDVVIADLGSDRLGLAAGTTITLDDNAAGWGWSLGSRSRRGRIDLRTALIHEVGHLLGHEHAPKGVMSPTLMPGAKKGTSRFSQSKR